MCPECSSPDNVSLTDEGSEVVNPGRTDGQPQRALRGTYGRVPQSSRGEARSRPSDDNSHLGVPRNSKFNLHRGINRFLDDAGVAEVAALVIVDLRNIYQECRNWFDYPKLLSDLQNSYAPNDEALCVVAYLYGDPGKVMSFQSLLVKLGYYVKFLDVNTVDVSVLKTLMELDAVFESAHTNRIVIVSGDGKFIRAAEILNALGKKVDVWSFASCLNDSLRTLACNVVDLDDSYLTSERRPRE